MKKYENIVVPILSGIITSFILSFFWTIASVLLVIGDGLFRYSVEVFFRILVVFLAISLTFGVLIALFIFLKNRYGSLVSWCAIFITVICVCIVLLEIFLIGALIFGQSYRYAVQLADSAVKSIF